MNGELIRLIDSIYRDKGIDKEIIFQGLESALLTAARKQYPQAEGLEIKIDRENGQILARDKNGPIDPASLGRIAAQTARQVIIQKIREAESNMIYADLVHKQHNIVTGVVLRFEKGDLVVNVGKTEAIIPKTEQVPGEFHQPGKHIKALVLNVKKQGSKVVTILSRRHPDFVRRLFELEIPEVADKTIEIKSLVREPGFRTKIAVSSNNSKVDAVGACVGGRGTRIKNIVEELYGEKIDIIKWDADPASFIRNSMKPVEVISVDILPEKKKAVVVVDPKDLSLAIGKQGQNIRLACKLTGWDIDVISSQPDTDLENKTPA